MDVNGGRTFQNGFTSKGHFVEYGKQDIWKLFILGKKIYRIQSKIDKHTKERLFISSRKDSIQESKEEVA